MATFHCMKCSYQFSLKGMKIPKTCPYCGKAGSVVQDKSAEQLIKEVEDLFKD